MLKQIIMQQQPICALIEVKKTDLIPNETVLGHGDFVQVMESIAEITTVAGAEKWVIYNFSCSSFVVQVASCPPH